MKKLVVTGRAFYLSDKAYFELKDMLYYCDDHEGYHIKPDDGYAGAMHIAEAMVFAMRNYNLMRQSDFIPDDHPRKTMFVELEEYFENFKKEKVMKTFKQAVKMLEKIEKIVGSEAVQIYFYADESGSAIIDNGIRQENLFSFESFDVIEAEFIEWQERTKEYWETRREEEPIYVGDCG